MKTDAANSITYQWQAADKYEKQYECIEVSVFNNAEDLRTRKYNCHIDHRTLFLVPVEASAAKCWQTVWNDVISMPKSLLGMTWWRHASGTWLCPWTGLVNSVGGYWVFIRDDIFNIGLRPSSPVFGFARSAWDGARTIFISVFTFVFRCARFNRHAKGTECTHHVYIFSHNATKSLSDVHWSLSFGVAQRLCWEGVKQESQEKIQDLGKVIRNIM
jgi:hypothetical protein